MKNLYPLSNKAFNELIDIRFNNINEGFNNFNNGILECTDNTLSFEEKENRFLNFFKDALNLNSNYLIIDFYLKDLNGKELLNLLDSLEYDNKVLLLEELKKLKDKSTYFSLTNYKLIELITILNTRALFFCTVYFKNIPFTIWGNYNLNFPVFFNDIKHLDIYINLATKHGLTITSINIKKEDSN